MEQYIQYIKIINKHLNGFSLYLNNSSISNLKESISTPEYLNLMESDLDLQKWPNGNSKGVYFLFGKKGSDENIVGIYIGKASVAIGHRLYGHLNPWKENRNYQMKDLFGNIFNLELVTSIALNEELDFFAPALEDYLISRLRKEIYLLNSIGNSSIL